MGNLYNRLASKFEREFFDALCIFGGERLLFSKRKGTAILCYHGVDAAGDKSLNMRHISVKSLERHFQLFSRYFNVIKLEDYARGRFAEDRFNLAITFDDGYRNNFKYLIPLAEKYGIPVSIYVTGINETPYEFLWADFVDIMAKHSGREHFVLCDQAFSRVNGIYVDAQGRRLHAAIKEHGGWSLKEELFALFPEFHGIASAEHLRDYWELMSDDEIREADSSPFVTIGSHGYYHDNLGNIPLAEAAADMRMSKTYLENLLQRDVDQIAFPDGSYSRQALDEAERLGFRYQLALDYHFVEDIVDHRLLDRQGVYPVYSETNQVLGIISSQG